MGEQGVAGVEWVLHVDMDQFLAAVELLRRPELAGLPVVVGGRGEPNERAVVSTASYEARAFGVRSGMPLRVARRRCPDAIFLPVDFPHYEAASATVMQTLRAWPGAVVEVLGWDEAFVGVVVAQGSSPTQVANGIRQTVFDATGLRCSVGIGDTLVRAKIATEFGKPDGTYQLTAATWFEVMGERPTQALWGVGPKYAQRLAALGVETVRQLSDTPLTTLVEAFGPAAGTHLSQLGRGEGRRAPDDTPWVARAHGRETTFQTDLVTRDEVAAALRVLAEQVVQDIEREGRACVRVHLKARFAPFFTFTKVRKLAGGATYDPAAIAQTALALFDALGDERPVRLLGVRAEMEPPEGGYVR